MHHYSDKSSDPIPLLTQLAKQGNHLNRQLTQLLEEQAILLPTQNFNDLRHQVVKEAKEMALMFELPHLCVVGLDGSIWL